MENVVRLLENETEEYQEDRILNMSLQNLRKRETYHERKQNKLCVECGDATNSEFASCETCLLRRSQLRQDKFQEGKCIKCSDPTTTGIMCCQKCNDRDKANKKVLRNTRIKNGFCGRCGEEPLVTKGLGFICLIKKKAHTHLGSEKKDLELLNKWEQQKRCCAYCGEAITWGDNLEIGHLISIYRIGKSRKESRKTTTINDINLPCNKCNHIQGQMHHLEFLDFCQYMYDKNVNNLLSSDTYAQHFIKICRYLNLRP